MAFVIMSQYDKRGIYNRKGYDLTSGLVSRTVSGTKQSKVSSERSRRCYQLDGQSESRKDKVFLVSQLGGAVQQDSEQL